MAIHVLEEEQSGVSYPAGYGQVYYDCLFIYNDDVHTDKDGSSAGFSYQVCMDNSLVQYLSYSSLIPGIQQQVILKAQKTLEHGE